MDPYIPQFSHPVRVDSVAIRKARRWRRNLLVVLSALTLFLLLAAVQEAGADTDGVDAGEIVIYREVPKRSALRQGHPATPVTVDAANSGNRVEPLSDNGLVDINTQQAATFSSHAPGLAHHPINGVMNSAGAFTSGSQRHSLMSPMTNRMSSVGGAVRSAGSVGGHIGSAMSSMHRATPATPATPALPSGVR